MRETNYKCDDQVYFATRVPDMSNTSAKQATRVLHECHTNNKSATRVKKFDFYNERNENIFSHTMSAIWQMKDYKERNNIILRITFWKCLFPMPNAFEKCTAKTELCNSKSYIKNVYTRLHTVTQHRFW